MKEFLVGHIVLKDVIDTKPAKIEKVKNLPCPKTRKNSWKHVWNKWVSIKVTSKVMQPECAISQKNSNIYGLGIIEEGKTIEALISLT